ncbi:MAG: WD40/YVTN/BNR-like repeat-containing protein, partial [Blastocatellia bacterium]
VFISNDGGLWGSNDAGTTFQSLNRSLSLVQFYGVAAHPTDANLTFGGTQDNGSEKRAPGSNQWKQFITGDGGFCFVDPTDPNILFSTYVYGNVFRFTADGDNFDKTIGSNQVFGEPDSGQRIEFIAPFTCDGVHDVLYFGTWRLFTSHDRGDTWAAPGGTLDLTKGTSPNGPSDAINAIGVGPADPNIIYTGSGEGRVMVTKDGGVTWTDVTSSLPNRSVTSITVSGTDSNIAYLTFSGYVSGHVFQTTNAGASWTDISGNLPDIPVNALFAYPSDPNTLIVGTDIGIFGSTVGGNEWGSFNVGLPPVVVNAFTLRPNQNIVAATYGRGAYELPAGIKPPPPDFSISLSPASVSASRGSAAPVMVKIVRTGGFSPSVSVTPPNASSFGVKVKPAKALTGDSVSFTLKIKANAPVGTQQLNFTAQDSSGVSHSASLALTIQ